MIALPDVNILIALAWSNHPHYDAAHDWFAANAHAGWATCVLTQSGFLRLSLNPQIVGVAIDCPAAVQLLEGLVAHPQHRFENVGPSLTGPQFDELAVRITGYRQVSDATLLHIARVHGMQLVTFDKAVSTLCPWDENVSLLHP